MEEDTVINEHDVSRKLMFQASPGLIYLWVLVRMSLQIVQTGSATVNGYHCSECRI